MRSNVQRSFQPAEFSEEVSLTLNLFAIETSSIGLLPSYRGKLC